MTRKPKPTALRLIEGNRGRRPFNKREPKPRPVVPKCPRHLNDAAKVEWKRIAKTLHKLGLLTEIDGGQLALYCQAWGRWIEAEDALKKHGTIVKAPKTGWPMSSPYLVVANKAMEQMQRALSEFGMSPASRARVQAAGVSCDEKGADLLS